MNSLGQQLVICLFIVGAVGSASCKTENLPSNSNANSYSNLNTAAPELPKRNQPGAVSPTPAPTISPDLSANKSANDALAEPNAGFSSDNPNAQKPNSDIIVVSKLIVPVQGIKKENLRDTFSEARSEGRVHNALDIMAAGGSPVLAATDGEIVRFHDSNLGGITIYQLSTDKRLVLYYAHLQSRAENIKEGDVVKKGTIIGYVGDTGNAGAGNYHLHFAMWITDDPKRFWEGINVNPYQYLR